jgi:hypothetical protein
MLLQQTQSRQQHPPCSRQLQPLPALTAVPVGTAAPTPLRLSLAGCDAHAEWLPTSSTIRYTSRSLPRSVRTVVGQPLCPLRPPHKPRNCPKPNRFLRFARILRLHHSPHLPPVFPPAQRDASSIPVLALSCWPELPTGRLSRITCWGATPPLARIWGSAPLGLMVRVQSR